MLSSSKVVVRFFLSAAWRAPPRPSAVPRHSLRFAPLARLQPSGRGSKTNRFRGSLLARGFLAPPRNPQRGAAYAASFFRGVARPFSFAPLLGRPSGGFEIGALKRIVLSADQLCHPFPQRLDWCLQLVSRPPPKGTPARRLPHASARTLCGRAGLPCATGRRRSHLTLSLTVTFILRA